MSGFAVGGAPIGTLVSELRIVTIPPRFMWEGETAKGRFDPTTPATFSWVVGDARYKIETEPSQFHWDVVNAIINAVAITETPGFEFKGVDSIVNATLITIPPGFEWVSQDGLSSAEGAVSVTTTPTVFQWVGVDATPEYSVLIDGIPNIEVTRVGTTITINVLNQEGRPVFIYKGPETKSGFSFLTNTNVFPLEETIAAETSPKYKGSFGITGNIGGEPVRLEGVKSRTRYSRKDE